MDRGNMATQGKHQAKHTRHNTCTWRTASRRTLLPVACAVLLIGITFAAGGCARHIDRAQIERWERGELSAQVRHGAGGTAYTGVPEPGQRAEVALPPQPTVDDYVAAAVAHNPMLAAARARVRMLAERVPQETSLADPMIEVAPLWRSGEASPMELMLGISQEVPFPGKLELRGRIATSQAAQAGAELAAARLQVINDTRRAYWMFYAAQRGIEVTQQTRGLLEQFHQIADANVRAGRAGQADVLRASVELANLDSELARLRQEKTSAAAMLNQLMNRPPDALLPDPVETDPPQVALDLPHLLQQALNVNPRLARLREAVHTAQLQQERARQEWLPDFHIGVSYGFMGLAGADMDEDDEWGLSLGMNLPLWTQRRRAMQREARFEAQMALAELAEEQNAITFRVQDAAARAASQHEQVRLFRQRILPEAAQTVEASAASYRAGRGDFIELIDNWRVLFNYRLLYHRNVAALQQALADLDAAVGTRETEMTTPPNRETSSASRPLP